MYLFTSTDFHDIRHYGGCVTRILKRGGGKNFLQIYKNIDQISKIAIVYTNNDYGYILAMEYLSPEEILKSC